MTLEELEALPDVTPRFDREVRLIDGKQVFVPILREPAKGLFQKLDDGVFTDPTTGLRWITGWVDGTRVRRLA
jgi:hypothetical protein